MNIHDFLSKEKDSVFLIDSTLREGVQAPINNVFGISESVEIAQMLISSGVDCIECGHPAASSFEFERLSAVVDSIGGDRCLGHARSHVDDILAVQKTGARWVGVFLGVNDLSLSNRQVGWSLEKALNQIKNSVSYAVSLGLNVRFTIEDTSRTDIDLVLQAYKIAVENGAHRLCYADTVGILSPSETRNSLQKCVNTFPEVEFEFHCHDDRGLAMSNSLEAAGVGVKWLSCSINGMGERAGITDTSALIANLLFMNKRNLDHPKLLQKLSSFVSDITGSPPDSRRPVIGKHIFTHTSKLHRLAVARNPLCYEWIPASKIGREHRIFDGCQKKEISNG